MKMQWWLVSLTLAIVLAGCETNTASNPSEPPSADATVEDSAVAAPDAVDSSQALNPQPPQSPFTAATSANQPLPIPNLIPPTASSTRSPQSEIGRPDPFSAVVVPPTVSIRATTPPASTVSPAASTAPPETTVAAAPIPTLPLPSVQPAPAGINQFPPVTLPTVPPPRLAEAIEISGVVEVGGKTSVIVQVPSEGTSRYVHVGDYVGNGNVLVKRVEMGIEPVVILEEDGAEVTRYVGGGSSLTGLL